MISLLRADIRPLSGEFKGRWPPLDRLVRIARDALERIGPTLERVRFRITGLAQLRHDIAQPPDAHLRQGDLCAPAQPVAQTGPPFRTENSNTDERKAE